MINNESTISLPDDIKKEVEKVKEKLAIQTREIGILESAKNSEKREIDKLIKEKNDIENQIANITVQIKENHLALETLQNERKQIESEREKQRTDIENDKKEIEEKKKELNERENKIKEKEKMIDIESGLLEEKEKEISNKYKEVEDFKKRLNDVLNEQR